MTTTPSPVNLQEALTSHANAIRLINVHLITRALLRAHTRAAITTALATIPAFCQETKHLRALLHIAKLDHANLVAAVCATVTADHEGEPDPLWYVRDELAARGQLPNPRRSA